MHPTIDPLFVSLCVRPDTSVDHSMWLALQTTLSLDDALALKDIAEIGLSQQHASGNNDYRLTQLSRDRKT